MTDRMALEALRLLIAVARFLVLDHPRYDRAVLEAADRAEAACNERARISVD